MSAARFGATLLDEVHEESLDQLLAHLRNSVDPQPKCSLGIPQLDRLFNFFQLPVHPSGTRNDEQDEYNQILPGSTFRGTTHADPAEERETFAADASLKQRKPILIELGGSAPSSGKTHLLYYITAVSILPRSHNGKEATVVWYDLDIAFSATRLHQICVDYLSRHNNAASTDAPTAEYRSSIAQEALKHVHVFSIASSKQLISSLDGLPDYLLQIQNNGPGSEREQQQHHSMHRPLSLIIVDSATAFYWTDRFDAEVARLESIGTTGPSRVADQHQDLPSRQPQTQRTSASPSTATQILTRLKAIQRRFENLVIYTTKTHLTTTTTTPTSTSTSTAPTFPAYAPSNASAPRANPHPVPNITLFNPWRHSSTLSLTLTRLSVPRFASHMTLAECLRDRSKRHEVVNRNRIRVDVDEVWLRERGLGMTTTGGGGGGGSSTVTVTATTNDTNDIAGGTSTDASRWTFVMKIGMDGVEIE